MKLSIVGCGLHTSHSVWHAAVLSRSRLRTRQCHASRLARFASGSWGLPWQISKPPLYAKSQGRPVKIWGYFSDNMLQYHVLPRDGRHILRMNIGAPF